MATAAIPHDDIEDAQRQVETTIRFVDPGDFLTRRYVSAGKEMNTGTYSDHVVTVRDGMPIRDHFELDVHGFTIAREPTQVSDFQDKAMVEKLYEAEVAASVDINTPSAHAMATNTYREMFPDGPGFKRFLITSYWRTFSPPPQDVPLALCDGRTSFGGEEKSNTLWIVDELPSEEEASRPEEGEEKRIAATIFSHNPAMRWWYFSNMDRDDALLFKFHDSDHARTWRCPHTAFIDPTFPDANIRESIECRSVAFWE